MSDLGFTRCTSCQIARCEHVVHRRPGVSWISGGARAFVIALIESSVEIRPLLPEAHLGVVLRHGMRSTGFARSRVPRAVS